MKINYDAAQDKQLFNEELRKGISWLLKIRDEDEKGWAWVQHIKPNEQNTAEVISALLTNNTLLDYKMYDTLIESIERWLFRPSSNAKITIDYTWVLLALQKVEKDDHCMKRIDHQELKRSIEECVQWLLENQNKDGGWADIKGDISGTTRTSLALIALFKEHKKSPSERIDKPLKEGICWLLDNQHSNGGWGNIKESEIDATYQQLVNLPYADLKYQCSPNAACTGYAMLALNEDEKNNRSALGKGFQFIQKSQEKHGRWDVFSEVGVRDGSKYTYRHFSTTWALRAALETGQTDYTDECIINGVNYLMKLQDKFYGGWKSSIDADNYTWSTCNALETIHLIKDQLSKVKAQQFLQIICNWWELKKKDPAYSLNLGKHIFAFNKPTCLLFCIVFTMLMFLLISYTTSIVPFLTQSAGFFSEQPQKFLSSIIIVIGIGIMGFPWVVLAKFSINKTMDNWINSFALVYGILCAFLFAYYTFIM